MVKPVSTKNTKISWARWRVPVFPATQEAEAGELPEPRRRRLRSAKVVPLHSSLGNNSKTPSQKKKKERKKESNLGPCMMAHAYNPSTLRGQGGQIT